MTKPFVRDGFVKKKDMIHTLSLRSKQSKATCYTHLKFLKEKGLVKQIPSGYLFSSYSTLWKLLNLNLRVSKTYISKRNRCWRQGKRIKNNGPSQSHYNRIVQLKGSDEIFSSRKRFETHLYYVELCAKHRQGTYRRMQRVMNKIYYRSRKIWENLPKQEETRGKQVGAILHCRKHAKILRELAKQEESFKRAYKMENGSPSLLSYSLGTFKASKLFGGKTCMFASIIFKDLERFGYIKRHNRGRVRLNQEKIKKKEYFRISDKIKGKTFWFFGYIYRQVKNTFDFLFSPFCYTDVRGGSKRTATDFDQYLGAFAGVPGVLKQLQAKDCLNLYNI